MSSHPILITGVSGFAGWHLTRALARHAPVVGTFYTRSIGFEGATTLAIDLADAAATRELIRSLAPRAVVHAAALTDPNECERRPELATRANEIATANLVAALDATALEAPLILFSTDLVYPGNRAFSTEGDPVGPVMHYGRTKLAAERLVAARRGPSTILRCALLYGPPAPYKSGATGWMKDKIERGEPLTLFADEYRTPVHVDDVVATVERCLEVSSSAGLAHEIFNLGGSERLTRLEMGQVLATALGHPWDCQRVSHLAESTMPAPRPADVSMNTTRVAALLGRRLLSFQDGAARCSAPQP